MRQSKGLQSVREKGNMNKLPKDIKKLEGQKPVDSDASFKGDGAAGMKRSAPLGKTNVPNMSKKDFTGNGYSEKPMENVCGKKTTGGSIRLK